jgi:hypothetical protein
MAAAQQGFDMPQFTASPPPNHHLRSARLLELRYISHVSFQNLSVDITIFSVTDAFYIIQSFLRPITTDDQFHIGTSSYQWPLQPTNQ